MNFDSKVMNLLDYRVAAINGSGGYTNRLINSAAVLSSRGYTKELINSVLFVNGSAAKTPHLNGGEGCTTEQINSVPHVNGSQEGADSDTQSNILQVLQAFTDTAATKLHN